MTRSEIEEIAEEAADKAIHRLFLTLGYNVQDPEVLMVLQEDLRFARKWRGAYETTSQHTLKTAIGVIVTGIIGWIGLVLWRGG
jgi:hypothetical protein